VQLQLRTFVLLHITIEVYDLQIQLKTCKGTDLQFANCIFANNFNRDSCIPSDGTICVL
jgi:hypothetical protein